MANKIDWYIVELERMLKGRIDPDALIDLQAETRVHLESAIANWEGPRPPDDEVERAAIQAFGPPDRLALRYLREMGARRRRVWEWLMPILAIVVFAYPLAAFFLAQGYGLFDAGPLHVSLWVWIWIFVGLAFVGSCLVQSRPLVWRLLGAIAVAFVACTVISASSVVWVVNDSDGVPVPKSWAADTAAEAQKDPGQFERTRTMLDRGRGAFAVSFNGSTIPREFKSGAGFVVPKVLAFGSGAKIPKMEWGTARDFRSARHAWTFVMGSVYEYQRQSRQVEAVAKAYASTHSVLDLKRLSWAAGFWGWAALGFSALTTGLHLVLLGISRSVGLERLRRRKLA